MAVDKSDMDQFENILAYIRNCDWKGVCLVETMRKDQRALVICFAQHDDAGVTLFPVLEMLTSDTVDLYQDPAQEVHR